MKYIVVVDEHKELLSFAHLLNAKYCSGTARVLMSEDHPSFERIDHADALYLVWPADIAGFGGSKASEFIQRSVGLLRRTPRVFLTACHVAEADSRSAAWQLGAAALARLLQEISPVTAVMATPGSLIVKSDNEIHVALSEKYLAKRGLETKTMWVQAAAL
jgi:hypothetical protein